MFRTQEKKQEATLTETLINWMPALSQVPQIIIEGSLVVLVTLTIFLLTKWGEYLLAAVSGLLYLVPMLRYMMH